MSGKYSIILVHYGIFPVHKFISEQTVPLYVFEQDKRVKGKQVQILHDLVTVSGEWTAIYVTDTGISGRRWSVRSREVRKPAGLLVREAASESRVIDCTDTA